MLALQTTVSCEKKTATGAPLCMFFVFEHLPKDAPVPVPFPCFSGASKSPLASFCLRCVFSSQPHTHTHTRGNRYSGSPCRGVCVVSSPLSRFSVSALRLSHVCTAGAWLKRFSLEHGREGTVETSLSVHVLPELALGFLVHPGHARRGVVSPFG